MASERPRWHMWMWAILWYLPFSRRETLFDEIYRTRALARKAVKEEPTLQGFPTKVIRVYVTVER